MARTFNGSSDKLVHGAGLGIGQPFTFACWFKRSNDVGVGALVTVAHTDLNVDRFQLFTHDAANGRIVGAQKVSGIGASSFAATTSGYTVGQWHHACGVFTSNASRAVYLDGGNTGTDTVSIGGNTINVSSIGALERLTPANFFPGEIMEVGVWNAALTAADVAILAAGFAPPCVRPQSLFSWVPLIGRNSPEIDLRRTREYTVTGTTAARHGRIIYPD